MKELFLKNSNENIKDLFKGFDLYASNKIEGLALDVSFTPFSFLRMFVDGDSFVITHYLDTVSTYKDSDFPEFSVKIDAFYKMIEQHGNAIIACFDMKPNTGDIELLEMMKLAYLADDGNIYDEQDNKLSMDVDPDHRKIPQERSVVAVMLTGRKLDSLPIVTVLMNTRFVYHDLQAPCNVGGILVTPVNDNINIKDVIFSSITEGDKVDKIVGNYDVFLADGTKSLRIPLFKEEVLTRLKNASVDFNKVKKFIKVSTNFEYKFENWNLVIDITSVKGNQGFLTWEHTFDEFWIYWVVGKQRFSYKYIIHIS